MADIGEGGKTKISTWNGEKVWPFTQWTIVYILTNYAIEYLHKTFRDHKQYIIDGKFIVYFAKRSNLEHVNII